MCVCVYVCVCICASIYFIDWTIETPTQNQRQEFRKLSMYTHMYDKHECK